MRCLQCGKALPLLKRLSGGEFCSDAHRKEYQQEYTNLALSRLQQAMMPQAPGNPAPLAPPPPEAAAPAPPPPPTSTETTAQPAPKQTPAVPIAPPPSHTAAQAPRAPAQASSAAGQAGAAPVKRTPPFVPRPQKAAAPPKKETLPAPAMAGALTRKPPAANMPLDAARGVIDMEASQTGLAVPRRSVAHVFATLPPASGVEWAGACEPRDCVTPIMESRLEVRGFIHVTPVLEFAVSIIGLPAWQLHPPAITQTIPVPAVAASAREAPVWLAPSRELASSIALSEWAALPLPPLQDDLAPQPADAAPPVERESVRSESAREESRGPALCLKPQPLALAALAPGKARPVQVFSHYLPGAFQARIPESGALPLRPTIVFGPTSGAAEPVRADKPRKPEVTILGPEKPAAGEAPAGEPLPPAREQRDGPREPSRVSLAQPVPRLDLGLPQLRTSPQSSIPSRIRKLFGGSKET